MFFQQFYTSSATNLPVVVFTAYIFVWQERRITVRSIHTHYSYVTLRLSTLTHSRIPEFFLIRKILLQLHA